MSTTTDAGRNRTDLAGLAKRAATVTAVVLAFAAVAGALLFASDLFLIVFAGILLSVFLRGIANVLAAHTPLSYGWALAIVVIGLLGIGAGLGVLFAPTLTSQARDLREQLPGAFDRFRAWIQGIDWLDDVVQDLPSPGSFVGGRRADILSRITGFFSTALGLLTDIVVIAFVGLYVAVAPGLYRRGVLALVPPRNRDRAGEVLAHVDHSLWWWLIAKLIAMVIVGVLTALGLWWLGIPAPAALGVLAALLTFIPNFGPVIAALPAILLALSQGLRDAGFVVLLYTGIQAVESYLITPNIEKKTISLPPALTISGQVLLGMLAGGLGLLVASPLCATAMVLVQELYVKRLTTETGQ